MPPTTIVDLYGGPGAGKSTSAAYIFSSLKGRGLNAELVQEYVKGWAWEGRRPTPYDQFYLLGKQIRAEALLYGRVSHIVTDSPVALLAYYARAHAPQNIAGAVREAVLGFYRQARLDGHRHVHVALQRSKPYNPAGRFQTEEQARAIDGEIMRLWDDTEIAEALGYYPYTLGTSRSELDEFIVDHILA